MKLGSKFLIASPNPSEGVLFIACQAQLLYYIILTTQEILGDSPTTVRCVIRIEFRCDL